MASVKEHRETAQVLILILVAAGIGYIGGLLQGFEKGADYTYNQLSILFIHSVNDAAKIIDCKYTNESVTIEKKQPLNVESKTSKWTN